MANKESNEIHSPPKTMRYSIVLWGTVQLAGNNCALDLKSQARNTICIFVRVRRVT